MTQHAHQGAMVMALASMVAIVAGACFTQDVAPPLREVPTVGVGGACTLETDCREGLICTQEGFCQPGADTAEGQPCLLTGQCVEGLFCADAGVCAPAGETAVGGPCGTTADCQRGLRCEALGLGGVCAETGDGDLGAACEGAADCMAGLGCGVDPLTPTAASTCLPPAAGGFPLPFPGVQCGEREGALRPLFEIPRQAPVTEFYSLPFPNDIRRNGTRPDLSGHPTPGDGVVGFDLVQSYLDIIQERQQGFGLNPAILVRFSHRLNLETLDARGENPSHFLVDITPESPEYNQQQPLFWQAATSRTRYICDNWLAMRPAWGRPLEPNTTYAAVITDAARGDSGEALTQDADFAAMLSETDPGGELSQPWQLHAPLRAWIADQGIDPATVTGAAVFTTGDPARVSRQLRQAVRDFGLPTASDLTLCDQGVTSPCDDGLEGDAHRRGCLDAANDGFHEIHGRIQLPVFQEGEAPYFDAGGGVAVEGAPAVQRTDNACMGMTVPTGEMPEAGWPVLIYAHGTGGSYRSHVGNVSGLVSQIDLGDGRSTGMLVVGWDQVQHFDRRGGSELDPETLVYNFRNPEAAMGNFHQAASEVHAIVSFVEALNIAAEDSPTGTAIKADPTQIYFLGHSQGGSSGAIALPFEPLVRAAVLSGAGASLTYSLLHKTSPVNAAAGVALALQDPDIHENHPVLGLIQGFFDPVDPVNYAQYIGGAQIEEVTTPRHLLQTLGLGDTFTPDLTLQTMAIATRGDVLGPLLEPFQRREVTPIDAPVSGNRGVGGARYTVVSRQYEPSGYDGHFVLFRNPDAIDDLQEFLGTAILDGIPTIAD